jgi:myo-inositol-1(or 4)-monophosphatase
VSIALQHKGIVTQGVVYDPNRNDLFTATRGAGAYLNDRRLRVSRRTRMDESLVATGFPFRDGSMVEIYLDMMRDMIHKTAGIRRAGAAALDLAHVAAGWYEGFWEVGLNPWDMAAGSLLVTEAGGLVTDMLGDDQYLQNGSIIAAAPKVLPQMLQTLSPHMHRQKAARGVARAG